MRYDENAWDFPLPLYRHDDPIAYDREDEADRLGEAEALLGEIAFLEHLERCNPQHFDPIHTVECNAEFDDIPF
jgi:hypothetical protein